MNYLVIDLEMCRVKKLYRKTYKYASEIIQIGAVLLDEGFNRIATMCEYVNPEYGVLDNFIESMTGIKNRDIKQASKLTEALEHLTDWLGDREYKVYAWSDSDRTQILHEIKAKNIESAKIDDFMKADRWIDYQDVFKKRFDLDSLRPSILRTTLSISLLANSIISSFKSTPFVVSVNLKCLS